MTKLYRLTRHGKPIASLQADQVEANDQRLKEIVAFAVGGRMRESIERGTVKRYTDGAMTVSPRRKNGMCCTDTRGDLTFYTLTPYWFNPTAHAVAAALAAETKD